VCSPVSMVTRSNALPLPEVKTPSFVTLSRIGPRILQGPHQLGNRCGQRTHGDGPHAGRRVLGVEISDDDLVLYLKYLVKPLAMDPDEYQPRTRKRRSACPHLLVDVLEMVKSPCGGRESSDEPPGRETGDGEHI